MGVVIADDHAIHVAQGRATLRLGRSASIKNTGIVYKANIT
tara:strand:- start:313 stop:435 length:123 start_codon:yes stop_codon:yes gene_type:complete